MLEVIHELKAALESGRRLAYCRLVETRGSTPQKAGASMLIFEDGSQAGTLGGGCVEAEVKKRALAAIADGRATIEQFMLDSDFGWDDGLICGGRMEVLVQPATSDAASQYFQRLAETAGQGGALTEVVSLADRESPGLTLLDEHGMHITSLNGDDNHQAAIQRELVPVTERPLAYVRERFAFLPLLRRCRLLIVGGGHVGKAVAELAATLDFDVWVVDDRSDFVEPSRFPTAQRRLHGPMDELLPELEITSDTYCLIVTRGHNHDEQALYHLADRGARYVGMIGSRRKIRLIMDDLLEEGVSPEALARVYAPVGVDIGSQTVPEIALSICAELVSHRNRQGAVPGRELPASARVEANES